MTAWLFCSHSDLDEPEESVVGTPKTTPLKTIPLVETGESYQILGKLAVFGLIVMVFAGWVRVSKGRQARDDVGYEKTLA
jgi:hypothetical protein